MLIALLADGHILVEGAPGLAKTRAINALSKGIQADFHRVQFTKIKAVTDRLYHPR
jgi:MoxR-like ATPase